LGAKKKMGALKIIGSKIKVGIRAFPNIFWAMFQGEHKRNCGEIKLITGEK
jgi:hypothetical protein